MFQPPSVVPAAATADFLPATQLPSDRAGNRPSLLDGAGNIVSHRGEDGLIAPRPTHVLVERIRVPEHPLDGGAAQRPLGEREALAGDGAELARDGERALGQLARLDQ